MINDLIIIGGGPAGTAGAVYAARKQLKTVLIASEFGGQSTVSEDIQNWIGTPHISGADLAKSFENHVREYAGEYIEIHNGEYVTSITKNEEGGFSVLTDKGTYSAKSVLLTVGSTRRKLEVPGADIFEHKGLTYCASCDGPLFSGQDVAVIGGGNAAFESAAQLLAYCKTVSIINRSDKFRADEITVEKIRSHENARIITNAQMTEVYGEGFVKGLKYKNEKDEIIDLPVTGIFIEIGLIPSTDLIGDLVEKNTYGQIKVDPKTQRTSVEGIWSAGDCTDGLYHQNNIAAGDAVKALEDLYQWVKTK